MRETQVGGHKEIMKIGHVWRSGTNCLAMAEKYKFSEGWVDQIIEVQSMAKAHKELANRNHSCRRRSRRIWCCSSIHNSPGVPRAGAMGAGRAGQRDTPTLRAGGWVYLSRNNLVAQAVYIEVKTAWADCCRGRQYGTSCLAVRKSGALGIGHLA